MTSWYNYDEKLTLTSKLVTGSEHEALSGGGSIQATEKIRGRKETYMFMNHRMHPERSLVSSC